jgi:hypothetical protein
MQRTTSLFTASLATLVLALAAPGVRADDRPNCKQDHPGRQNRVEDSIKKGDSEIAKKVARHTVKYAIQRWNLDGLVSDNEIDNAKDRMYSFLKWKLGSPSAVCGQWVSSGYGHFDKAYSDEAAGLVLGIFKFEDHQPEILVPAWLQKTLVGKAESSGPGIAAVLSSYGVPEVVAQPLGQKIAAELAKATERNTVGYYLPKEFDYDNRLVTAAAAARRAYLAENAKKLTGGVKKPEPGKGGDPAKKGKEKTPPPAPVPAPKKKG